MPNLSWVIVWSPYSMRLTFSSVEIWRQGKNVAFTLLISLFKKSSCARLGSLEREEILSGLL
jgi:hypothetical protein